MPSSFSRQQLMDNHNDGDNGSNAMIEETTTGSTVVIAPLPTNIFCVGF